MPYPIFTLRRWAAASIGALLIGAMAGAQADSPAAAVTNGEVKHELILHSAAARSVIELLHWTTPGNLPEGVTSVTATPFGNALIVAGTDAGFESVKEIVQLLDIPAKSVRLQVQFVSAKTWDVISSGVPLTLLGPAPAKRETIMAAADTRIQQASGDPVARLQAALAKSRSDIAAPAITSPNNVECAVNLGAIAGLPALIGCNVFITPRTNDDRSVTLFLRAVVTTRTGSAGQKEEAQETKLVDKVVSGRPVMIGNLARAGAGARDQELVIFVTPTILEDKP